MDKSNDVGSVYIQVGRAVVAISAHSLQNNEPQKRRFNCCFPRKRRNRVTVDNILSYDGSASLFPNEFA